MSDEVFLDKKNGGYQDFEIGIVKIEKKIKVSLGYILKYWCSDFKKEKRNWKINGETTENRALAWYCVEKISTY